MLGLKSVDYRVTDVHADPVASKRIIYHIILLILDFVFKILFYLEPYSEQLIRLPGW